MNEKDEYKLLNYIRQNVEMGIDGIDMIYDHVKNRDFKNVLSAQREGYVQFFSKADTMLRQKRGEPQDIPVMAKMGSSVMGKMKAYTNMSDSEFAEDMIKGTSTGISKLTKHLHDYQGSDNDIKDLANTLLKTEEDNINVLKAYL